LVGFYEEILKTYLPPRYKNTNVGLIPIIDLNKAIKKWSEKNVFNKKNLISYYEKSVWRVDAMIESCLNLISIYINLKIIKSLLLILLITNVK